MSQQNINTNETTNENNPSQNSTLSDFETDPIERDYWARMQNITMPYSPSSSQLFTTQTSCSESNTNNLDYSRSNNDIQNSWNETPSCAQSIPGLYPSWEESWTANTGWNRSQNSSRNDNCQSIAASLENTNSLNSTFELPVFNLPEENLHHVWISQQLAWEDEADESQRLAWEAEVEKAQQNTVTSSQESTSTYYTAYESFSQQER